MRMILGASTPYAEYRCCYNRMVRQFRQSVGEAAYQRLANGGYLPTSTTCVAARADENKGAPSRIEVCAL